MRARSAPTAGSTQHRQQTVGRTTRSYDSGDRIVSIATGIDRFYAARYHSPWPPGDGSTDQHRRRSQSFQWAMVQ
eukprot:scaffold7890_cov112-Isochrysis_galbana.AAC.1